MTSSHVQVKCIFKLGRSRDIRPLMKMYGDKFALLMSHAVSSSFTPVDYKDLPVIRAYLKDNPTVSSLSDILVNTNPNLSKMVLDVTPIFDRSPLDLKAFILLSIGVRSNHILGVSHA